MSPHDTHREQLSSLIDGALDADRRRFLLRRLQHDAELAQSLSRWQLAGDVLRGQAQAPAPTGFAEAVAARIAGEPVPAPHDERVPGSIVTQPASPPLATSAAPGPRHRVARWGWFGGGAVAASLTMALLFGVRPGAETAHSEAVSVARVAPVPEQAVATPAPTPNAVPVAASTEDADSSASPRIDASARSPAARRASDAPRLARTTPAPVVRASAAATPEAATPRLASEAPRLRRSVALAEAAATPPAADPFQAPVVARPWPRAVVPGVTHSINASLETASPYAPFAPRSEPVLEGGRE